MKFECEKTGKCCSNHGDHQFVFLTPKDIERLESHLKRPAREFVKLSEFESTRFEPNKKGKYSHLLNPDEKCRFIKDGLCSVYEARPTQCRTWPFFPEHLSKENWRKLSAYCGGIGRGKDLKQEDVEDLVNQQIEADGEY